MKKLQIVILLCILCICNTHSMQFLIDPVIQWQNCNNCYAVAARDVLLYHMPHLKNVTVKELMQDSHQSCNGGIPTKIWNHYFRRGAKVTSITKMGNFQQKLAETIQNHGPVVLNRGTNHLVTAFNVDKKGILIRDPKNLNLEIWEISDIIKEQKKGFFYISHPLL